MIKVSVLIPLFNTDEYIKDTIFSVLQQTYKNIEIIIVDDGSVDSSYKIAKTYESDNVKVYKQSNRGAAAARNKAFELSSGDLIQYLDADDLLDKNKIKLQVEEYIKHNNDNIIISGTWGRFTGTPNNVRWEKQPIDKDYDKPIKWLIDSWNGKGMQALHSWLTPRKLIEKTGKWNESLSLNDDGEFFCRVLIKAHSIIYVPGSKVYYRSGISNSISKSRTYKALLSEFNSYKLYCKHTLTQHNNLKLRKALASNFLNFAYQYYSANKNLSLEAMSEFNKLKVGKPWPIGGHAFKITAKSLGFINALKFRKIVKI